MMRKAVLHNCKAIDTLQHLREISVLQFKQCYIFIPDQSFNVTHLMTHMKNQISALRDPFPSLDDLKKKKKKLAWCGRLMAKIFTFNSTNVINYTISILLVSQDYYFLNC